MRIRENLGGIIRATGNRNVTPTSKKKTDIGKVYGVVLDENTPSKNAFEKAGGWSGIGSVYYLDYSTGITTSVESINKEDLIKICKLAKPLDPSNQNYPLLGELIVLVDAPSPVSQVDNTAGQKYYTSTVNVWNNNQQNSPDTVNLGKTFIENGDIRLLRSFEGDRIYQGRKGNGIRFGSTVKSKSNINEWSSTGNDGDPITIMVNGYITTDTGSLIPNIEEINKEMSSLYMTSTQTIPLIPGASIINPINSAIQPNKYNNSQLILNSDRITINSKKDEVLVFAKTNIDFNTDNIINLNAGYYIHLNSEKILLGTKPNKTVPTEPVLLGSQTHDLLLETFNSLQRLASYLASAVIISSDGPIPIPAANDGGTQLLNDVTNLIDKLGSIQSNKVFTT